MIYFYLNGFIDSRLYKEVQDFLRNHKGEKVFIVIDSYGGSIFQSFGIAQMIKSHGQVTTLVNGLAASGASIVSVSGAERVITPMSRIMVHGPWTNEGGNVEKLEKSLQILKETREELRSFYQEHTNLPADILQDAMEGEEWFSANQALQYGLVDKVDADHDLFAHIPQEEIVVMFENREKTIEIFASLQGKGEGGETATSPTPTTTVEEPHNSTQDVVKVIQDTVKEEVQRLRKDFEERFVNTNQPNPIKNQGIDIDRLAERLQASMNLPEPTPTVAVDEEVSRETGLSKDEIKNFVKEKADILVEYAQGKNAITYDVVAALCLEKEGREVPLARGGRIQNAFMAGAVPGNTGALFPLVIGSAFQRVVLEGWETEGISTWREWCQRGPLSTFLPTPIAGIFADKGPLDKVPNSGEIKTTKISEAGNVIQAAEYANRFPITEKTLRNDTADIFDGIPREMGEKATYTVDHLVYKVLQDNEELSSGGNLFVDARNSLDGALNSDNLSLAISMMLLADKPRMPVNLVVPPQLQGAAELLLNARQINSTDNIHYQRLNLVVATHLSSKPTEWYLTAARGTVMVGFVDGERPQIQQHTMWDTIGLDTRVILRVGAASKDWRGLLRGGVSP